MVNPVSTPAGQTYERDCIVNILSTFEILSIFDCSVDTHPIDPLTQLPCRVEDLRPNLALKKLIEDFKAGSLIVKFISN